MRDDLWLMFSGSLHYMEITQVVYWYEERMEKYKHVYDENIGMVLTATQDDIVLFGTNSGVVLNALSQYIKTF